MLIVVLNTLIDAVMQLTSPKDGMHKLILTYDGSSIYFTLFSSAIRADREVYLNRTIFTYAESTMVEVI